MVELFILLVNRTEAGLAAGVASKSAGRYVSCVETTIESARPVCLPAGHAVRPASKPVRTYTYFFFLLISFCK